MKTENIQHAAEIFVHALDEPVERRASFVFDSCRGDVDLAADVTSLLKSYEGGLGDLEQPVFRLPFARLRSREDPPCLRDRDLTGCVIDGHRILRKIGGGGTGVVWLAERAVGRATQHVAIKLIDPSVVADADRLFNTEVAALARLSHPFIARLYGAGVTEDGIPFVVTEHVDGRRIDHHCRDQGLPIPRRLELFRCVCEAVEYAHRNLLVHLDIKPANILVDSEGHPKLLDFGIAKLLQPLAAQTSDLSSATTRLCTPEYASPEQLRGEPVTTAADVFSLGVVLYELITETRYRDHAPPGVSQHEWWDRTPELPSVVIARRASNQKSRPTSSPFGAMLRRMTARPALLSTPLDDLDMVVLKALRPEPDRRYRSVEQLSDDLHRYMVGLPVSARDDTWRYRFGKYLKRHRTAVGVALAAIVGLVTTAAGTSIGLVRATAARRQTEQQVQVAQSAEALAHARLQQISEAREVAEHEAVMHREAAERAQSTLSFFAKAIQATDPFAGSNSHVAFRQMLDQAAVRIPYELGHHSGTEASVRLVMAEAYRSLGLFGETTIQLERCLTLRRQVYGDRHPAVAECLYQFGKLYEAVADWESSQAVLVEALAILEGQSVRDEIAIADARANLAWTLEHRWGHEAAWEPLQQAAIGFQEHAGETDPRTLLCKVDVARMHWLRREPLAAIELLDRIDQVEWDSLHQRPAETLRALAHFAKVKQEVGELAAGDALFRQQLRLTKLWFGERHPAVASSLSDIAKSTFQLGRIEDAIRLTQDAHGILRQYFDADSPTRLQNLCYEAGYRWAWGDYGVAESVFRAALQLEEQRHPEGKSERWVGIVSSLAVVLRDAERWEDAESYFQQAFDAANLRSSVDPILIARLINNLARLEFLRGDYTRAEALARDALHRRSSVLESNHPDIAETKLVLGSILTECGDVQEAEALLRESSLARGRLYPRDHWLVAEAESALGWNLVRQGRMSDAETLLLSSWHATASVLLPEHVVRQTVGRRLASLYSRPEMKSDGALGTHSAEQATLESGIAPSEPDAHPAK